MKRHFYFLSTAIILLLFHIGCSKSDDTGGGNDGGLPNIGYPTDLQGTIYYKWATEGVLKMGLPDGTGGSFISDDRKLNSFDISYDGKYRLTAEDASSFGKYIVKVTLSNLSDGAIIEQFDYTSPGKNIYAKAFLSHDNAFIMMLSKDKDDGITILKRNGEFVTRLIDFNGEPIDPFNAICKWLPNNALLVTHKNYIFKIEAPYQSGTLIKEMEYQDWDELTVNDKGTQLALRIDKHIYTMRMDGSNLKQVTTSNFKESVPVFSPDGKYLLVGTHYRQTGPFGFSWYMKIIPNDGKIYNVDPVETNSPGVIPVIWKGKDKIESAGGQVIWR
ncbi:hypothetical protein FXV77_07060 [Sphingobacterium phlebotomi]|uniref:WD40 repeat protein n=1 Tax=Sphingobacterium phlebotomi TaxID=2605433 RepID=A0A5D4H789_9SPHI|nr:hypothetical protein [Sphingobacterium phlebotomi]TYR36931.1 hypothetical protein FXV77_07060 [Sphingobacterium phlebotomi]